MAPHMRTRNDNGSGRETIQINNNIDIRLSHILLSQLFRFGKWF